jgi:hypothetical protein
MHVILKLIGHIITEEDGKYFYEIRLNNINIISFDVMKTLLISYGIEDEDIQNITITCDCKNIKNDSIISSYIDEEKKIYIYTCKDKVRSQLEEIFITYGHKTLLQPANQNKALFDDLNSQNEELDNSNEAVDNPNEEADNSNEEADNSNEEADNSNEEADNSNEEADNSNEEKDEIELDFTKINNETKILLENKDFIFLLNIYLNKPEIFKTFYKYISSGNIVINKKEKLISDEEILESTKLILDLDLGFSEEDISNALKLTGNHINLSIRYLIIKKVEEKI